MGLSATVGRAEFREAFPDEASCVRYLFRPALAGWFCLPVWRDALRVSQ